MIGIYKIAHTHKEPTSPIGMTERCLVVSLFLSSESSSFLFISDPRCSRLRCPPNSGLGNSWYHPYTRQSPRKRKMGLELANTRRCPFEFVFCECWAKVGRYI